MVKSRRTSDSEAPDVADRLPEDPGETVVILNPVSGDGDHEQLRRRSNDQNTPRN